MPWMRVRGVMTSRTTVSPNSTTLRISSRSSSSRMPSASPSSRRAVTASSWAPPGPRRPGCGPGPPAWRWTTRARGATRGAEDRWAGPYQGEQPVHPRRRGRWRPPGWAGPGPGPRGRPRSPLRVYPPPARHHAHAGHARPRRTTRRTWFHRDMPRPRAWGRARSPARRRVGDGPLLQQPPALDGRQGAQGLQQGGHDRPVDQDQHTQGHQPARQGATRRFAH